jgi:hypothetical protein
MKKMQLAPNYKSLTSFSVGTIFVSLSLSANFHEVCLEKNESMQMARFQFNAKVESKTICPLPDAIRDI